MSPAALEDERKFARRNVSKGHLQGLIEGVFQGWAKGRMAILIEQLTFRFGPLSDTVRTHICGAEEEQLDCIAKRVLTALTLEEAVPSLGLTRNLSTDAPETCGTAMGSSEFKAQSEFARRQFAEGREQGLISGRRVGCIELIERWLSVRFGPLPDAVLARVRGAHEAQLNIIAERILTARTLEEVFEPA